MRKEPRLSHPAGIEDFLLWRMNKIVALGGSLVTRLCEGRFGITRREWTVLGILARQTQLPWTDLAQRCEIDNAQLSRAVTSLASKGLAEKTHLPNRRIEVSLTPKGSELYTELFPLARDINLGLLRELDIESVAALDQLLDALHTQGEQLSRETSVPKAARLLGRRR
ncbi:MAG: MarR family transcriptional regulator [Polaromonas sp.]|nr:MarR family transcriptional regulator [Polaromonas sp.]